MVFDVVIVWKELVLSCDLDISAVEDSELRRDTVLLVACVLLASADSPSFDKVLLLVTQAEEVMYSSCEAVFISSSLEAAIEPSSGSDEGFDESSAGMEVVVDEGLVGIISRIEKCVIWLAMLLSVDSEMLLNGSLDLVLACHRVVTLRVVDMVTVT